MPDRTPATQAPPGEAAPPPSGAPASGTADGSHGSATPQLARPIASLTRGVRATVEGRVRTIEIRPAERNTVLAYEIEDPTGHLTALFYGRSHIAGVYCGSRLRLSGRIGTENGRPVMINPAYQLLAAGEPPRPR
jgi:RecG-like helicase